MLRTRRDIFGEVQSETKGEIKSVLGGVVMEGR
jgi:hypothetical protein